MNYTIGQFKTVSSIIELNFNLWDKIKVSKHDNA